METSNRQREIYLALAMEGLSPRDIAARVEEFRALLQSLPVTVRTTFDEADVVRDSHEDDDGRARRIVEADLDMLRRADLLLVDLSRENHTYVGCICEIVYAHLMRIPVIAFVGNKDWDERTWLRYHVTSFCKRFDSIPGEVARTLGLEEQ
jgi:nucleoside 2-deoxyribosyltransferase